MIAQETKDKYVALAKQHRAADIIFQGQYWENGKGCAVGCMAQTSEKPHSKLEQDTNIPEWLFYLQDKIFEGLKNEEAANFVVDFWEAIPVGVDLEPVRFKFLSWLQKKNIEYVKALDIDNKLKDEVLGAINGVKIWLDDPNRTEEARKAAEAAAGASVRSAAEAAAWSAVAETAAWSAWSAVAETAAWAAARSAVWAAVSAQRDKLLELLRDAANER